MKNHVENEIATAGLNIRHEPLKELRVWGSKWHPK